MTRNVETVNPAPRGRPRDTRLDEAILHAALDLFAHGGQESVTFEGVAARARVSRGAVYRRWHSQEEMIGAALVQRRERGERGAEGWESATSIADVLTLFADRAVQTLTDPRSLGLLAQVQALDHGSPIRRTYWTTIVEPRRLAMSRIIVTARDRGEIAPGPDPDVVQDLLAGALSYRALTHPEPLSEAGARRYVHGVLEALGLTGPYPAPRVSTGNDADSQGAIDG